MIRTVVAALVTLALVLVPAGIATAADEPVGSEVPAPWHPTSPNGLDPAMTGGVLGSPIVGGWDPGRTLTNPPVPVGAVCEHSNGCVPMLVTFGEIGPNAAGTLWQMTYGWRVVGADNQVGWMNIKIEAKCSSSPNSGEPSEWSNVTTRSGNHFLYGERTVTVCPTSAPWLYAVRVLAYQDRTYPVAPRYYEWRAGRDFAPYDIDDELISCLEARSYEECMAPDEIDPDDAADFATVCADAPAAEWLSFGWLGDWVGHYADCLFIPRAGFPTEAVENSYNATALGQFHGLYNGVKDSVSLAGSCGVIYSGSPGVLRGSTIQVDTCSWQPLSGFRVLVTILLYVAAGFMIYRMITKAFGFRSIGDSISSAGD